MRILQIIPTLVRGGAEKQLTLLACGLPRPEFDVQVVVLTHDGPYHETLTAHGVPVHLVGKRSKCDPSSFFRLRRLIRELSPDLVHTWIFAANSYGRAAAWSAGVKHLVAGERCLDPWKAWHQLAIDRFLARRTTRIVTNSSGVRDFYVEHGIAADKFAIIPNGIEATALEATEFEVTEASRAELLTELGLPADARLVGAVGRLWPQKRYKDLIWAAELLKAGRGDTHLLVVGDGPQRDELVGYARDVQVLDHVHFLGERGDVPRLLRHLDCFWLGSGYEGQSNALMEAMLAGRPVVVSDIAGNRDLVVPEVTGFLVPVGDAGQFARRTHAILDDAPLAERLGAAARHRMLTEFSVDQMIARHAELYRQILRS